MIADQIITPSGWHKYGDKEKKTEHQCKISDNTKAMENTKRQQQTANDTVRHKNQRAYKTMFKMTDK